MLRPAAFLLLASLLLWPAASPAQTPAAAKAPPRLVSIQVAFVAAEGTDVDALGINFNLLPLPEPPHTFLKYADGNIVTQLYQTLTRTRGKAILSAPMTTPDDVPAAIAVDAKVPEYTPPAVISNGSIAGRSPAPQLLGFAQIQGKLTLTPHITSGNGISLDIDSGHPGGKPIHFQASPSGGSLVIAAPHTNGADAPILGGLVRLPDTFPNYEEVLIFITPTILPAPAQTAIKPDNLYYRTIVLRHIAPRDVLTLMHWENGMVDMDPFKPKQTSQTAPSTYAKLPVGVAQIFALQSNNSLLVYATEEGYTQVKNIVKILDIAPRQVEIKVLFAAIPASQKLAVDLTDPNQALLQLHQAGAIFYQPPQVMTDNDTPAAFPLEWQLLDAPFFKSGITQSNQANQVMAIPTLHITPRINSDDSVTMNIDFGELTASDAPEGPSQTLTTIRTAPSAGMTAYDVTDQLKAAKYRVFLFVTPTTLSASVNNDNITITP